MKERPPKVETNPWLYGAEVDENEPIIQTARSVWWCDLAAADGEFFGRRGRLTPKCKD